MAKQFTNTEAHASSNSLDSLTVKGDLNEIFGKAEVSQDRGVIVTFKPGETKGPFIITSINQIDMSDGEPNEKPKILVAYDGAGPDGTRFRLPIGAIFEQKARELHIAVGDKIYIREEQPVIKARGKGNGKPMRDWTIARVAKNCPIPPAPRKVLAPVESK